MSFTDGNPNTVNWLLPITTDGNIDPRRLHPVKDVELSKEFPLEAITINDAGQQHRGVAHRIIEAMPAPRKIFYP